MSKVIPAAAALAAAAALLVPTLARADDTSSVRVSYADLNLASDVGQSSLHRRIVFAARVVCQFEDFAPASDPDRDQCMPQRCRCERAAGL